MSRVTFVLPAYLATFAEGSSRVDVEVQGGTVKAALDALFTKHRGLRDRILDEQGAVRQHVNIFVGDEAIRYTGGLETRVSNGNTLTVLPAISGGS